MLIQLSGVKWDFMDNIKKLVMDKFKYKLKFLVYEVNFFMLRSSKQSRREWTRSRQVSSPEISFRHNRPLHFMIAVFVLAWGGLAISPVDRRDWLLENAVLLLFVAALAILYRFFKFSNRSYLFITLFCILHMIGAHYAYKNTPMDFWAKNHFRDEEG